MIPLHSLFVLDLHLSGLSLRAMAHVLFGPLVLYYYCQVLGFCLYLASWCALLSSSIPFLDIVRSSVYTLGLLSYILSVWHFI